MANVWVIDDNALVQRACARLLRARPHGLEVHTFSSAEEAERAITAEPAPAGLLLDHRLPGELGLSFGTRHCDRLRWTEVVVMTGDDDRQLRVDVFGLGWFLLDKPVPPSFMSTFAAAVRARSASRQIRGVTPPQAARFAAFATLLTTQQTDILALHVRGLVPKQIADKLGIEEGTVRCHNHAIFDRLGIREMREIVRRILSESEPVTPGGVYTVYTRW